MKLSSASGVSEAKVGNPSQTGMHGRLLRITCLAGLLAATMLVATPAGCKSKPAESAELPRVPVELATVVQKDLPILRQAVGTLRANQIAQIAPEVAGKILSVEFQDGQRVNEKDPLFVLDSQQQQKDYEKAKALFVQADWNYTKTLDLNKKGAVGELELSQAKADRDSALAVMTQGQVIVDKLTIRAPFSGKLSVRQVDKGNYVSVGQALVVLQQDDPMLVDFNIPESYASELALGQPVFVTIPEYEGNITTQPESSPAPKPTQTLEPIRTASTAPTQPTPTPTSTRAIQFPDITVEGRVIAIAPFIDQSTRSISIRGQFDNPDHRLISGQFVKIDLRVGWQKNAIVIPQESIVIGEKGSEVFVVENDQAKKYPIRVYDFTSNNAVITGLKPGQIIVRNGWQKLRNGSKITDVGSLEQAR